MPSSAQALLEIRLGEWGRDALGFVAHIPHYLAQLDYPQASVMLLEHVERAGRLTLDLTDLRAAAEEREGEIARYLSANEEVGDVVASLERQYDSFAAGRGDRLEPARRGPADPDRRGDRAAVRAVPRRARGRRRPRRGRAEDDAMTPTPAQELIALLDLEYLDVDLFRGSQPESTRQRVYGGQVAAQSLVAGAAHACPRASTCTRCTPTSCCPATTRCRSIYDVERIRDGRSFATRRVMARQHGRPIYYQTLSFQQRRGRLRPPGHNVPDVKGPEHGLDLVELMRGGGNEDADALGKEWAALDVRWLGNSRHGLEPDPAPSPRRREMWIKIQGSMGDDPIDHLAAFTYASDVSLLGASLAAHQADPSSVQMASLDHTIWFHRPFRVDHWWLYDQHSPRPPVPGFLLRPRLHPRRPPRGHRRPGGPDPAPDPVPHVG